MHHAEAFVCMLLADCLSADMAATISGFSFSSGHVSAIASSIASLELPSRIHVSTC